MAERNFTVWHSVRDKHVPKTQSVSLLGVKRTWPIAVHMSANDPKRTSGLNISYSPLRCKVVGFKPY